MFRRRVVFGLVACLLAVLIVDREVDREVDRQAVNEADKEEAHRTPSVRRCRDGSLIRNRCDK